MYKTFKRNVKNFKVNFLQIWILWLSCQIYWCMSFQVQSEQERRKFETEKRVMGTETAVLEWIHQQFATLKSSLTMQHSIAGIG